jgi:hypothetical protein
MTQKEAEEAEQLLGCTHPQYRPRKKKQVGCICQDYEWRSFQSGWIEVDGTGMWNSQKWKLLIGHMSRAAVFQLIRGGLESESPYFFDGDKWGDESVTSVFLTFDNIYTSRAVIRVK